MSFGEAIKKLRKDAGLSQQDVADKLGMARATYASLEVDRREPDLGELKAIADFYEISMMELVAEEGDDWPGVIHEPAPTYHRGSSSDSANAKKPSALKLQQILLYITGQIGARPNIGESALYKLLYIIEREFTEKYGYSLTGISFVQSRFGPAPTKALGATLKDMQTSGQLEIVATKHFSNTNKKYLPVASIDLTAINAAELQHIDQILAMHANKTAAELLHNCTPKIHKGHKH